MSVVLVPWVVSHHYLNPLERYNIQVARGVDFGIKPRETVLDVGPMCFPFPLATHRMGSDERDDPKDGKPFFLSDIQERTPFKDKQFDFVYCSHVLEHLDNPVAGALELSRIGKRGYIEVPSGYCTMYLFYGLVHPKWFFYTDPDGGFVFTQWDPRILKFYEDLAARGAMDRIVNGDATVEHLTSRELILKNFYYKNADLFDPSQLWKDSIKIRKGAWFE